MLNETQSRILTIGSLGISDTIRNKKGTFILDINYHKGLDWFNAKSDPTLLSYDQNVAQFEKIDFNFNYYKKLNLFHHNFNFPTKINGQYSNHHLYSSEQISIGDQYSVRGYKEDSITGDSGGYINNEVSAYLPEIFTDKYMMNKILRHHQFIISYGVGYTRQRGGKETNNEGEGYISGYSLRLKYQGKHLNYNITYGKALHHPIFTNVQSEELYISTDIKF